VLCAYSGRVRAFVVGFFFLALSCRLTAGVLPLTTNEIGLMLRSGYSSDAVLRELSTRKFGDSLDSAAESQLKKAGASEVLIAALRNGTYQLSPEEISVAKEKERARAEKMSAPAVEGATTSLAKNAAQQQQVGGTMFDHLKGDLVYWHEGSFVPFDDELLERKKFYLLFFSAFWSKDGRQFTSRLVDYYNRVAPQHPEFEVVFFSADRSEFAMQNYVSQTGMPWPAVAYQKRDGKGGAIAENLVHGIPCLILSDAAGKILSRTEENSGPDKVLADLDKVLAASK
jgi:nucleoredoxin